MAIFFPSIQPSLRSSCRNAEDRAAGSSAIIQETYAEDFPCLLRVGWKTKSREQSTERKTKDFFSHGVSPVVLLTTERYRIKRNAR